MRVMCHLPSHNSTMRWAGWGPLYGKLQFCSPAPTPRSQGSHYLNPEVYCTNASGGLSNQIGPVDFLTIMAEVRRGHNIRASQNLTG